MVRPISFAVSALLLSSSAVHAVVYFEGADLSNSGTLTTFTLDLGQNTIGGATGETRFGDSISAGDYDSFAFVVPAGTQVTSASVALPEPSNLTGVFRAAWGLRSGSNVHDGGSYVEFVSATAPGAAFVAGVPLGPGTYNLSAAGIETGGGESRASYAFNFTVVPEPGSLAALGLAGLALLRRQRPAPHA